ncbi:hypothetical protein ILUMI_20660 [Ignelater luminosus]|uniref:G-protein coupled receptors family 1 profile domain-containing protein n=1 Tax=Ignelater luminosus TaxID=2038154 RepID=A0A8K0FYP9_IGNLU|nr:hypothetical protein ILUMI_20660 [Ignelater luminosus]
MNFTLLNETCSDEEELISYFKNTYPINSWKTIGLFHDDFIKTINVHWLKFPPPHKINHYALAVLYVFIMTFGWFGNAFVISTFIRCPSLRTPANTLVMNLAISDLLMMSKMPIFIFNSTHLGPALGKFGCYIHGFVGGLSGTVSITTLAAISLDRYYVIKFPLNMRFTRVRAKICVAVTWIYSMIFSVIPLLDFKFGSYVPEGYLTSCSFDYLSDKEEVRMFILIFFIAAWVVPFSMITFCYINILRTVLKTRDLARKDSESSRHMKLEEKRNQEIKLAGIILFVIALWFAAWTPYAVVALLGISNNLQLISPLASMIPALFCKSASCIDPFVYAITNSKFKSEAYKLYCKRSTRKTSKIWTSRHSTSIERSTENRKPRRMHSCQDSEEVEEEFVSVRIRRDEKVQIPSPTEMGNFKPSWWYKPNFSNRGSSLRSLARNLHQRQESLNCEYCEEQKEQICNVSDCL